MATQAIGKHPAPSRPTTFYFAYGSNLHLKQMKRRCPQSKYIGRARLTNHRWQINERGYANVVESEGHWVDGLVYEINGVDEAKLDINEGVSKKAYIKKYMNVHLHRAKTPLYRRPISWIVDRGGPAKICRQAKEEGQKVAEHPQSWVQEVLVYISLTCITDSDPKDEYINRINLGLADAKSLGVDEDYISNCVRPFIPEPPKKAVSAVGGSKTAARGQKRNGISRTGERPPARKGKRAAKRPNNQTLQQAPGNSGHNKAVDTKTVVSKAIPPPAPPRSSSRRQDISIIVVEEFHSSRIKRNVLVVQDEA